MDLPVTFPLKPMLAKPTDGIPTTGDWLFEPKWDGFRCLVFRDGDEVELGSRNERPLTRYFPEMLAPLKAALPRRCVVDGEIVVALDDESGRRVLDFDALGQRIHPAESRVGMLAEKTPADFVAFDLIALDDRSLLGTPFAQRRSMLESAVTPGPQVHITPVTADRDEAADWFRRVEGAGLDGLIAKDPDGVYQPDKRVLRKVKHQRTADCVATGFRWHKDGNGVGSILLGIYTPDGELRHVGVSASFKTAFRAELVDELTPLIEDDFSRHPWSRWSDDAEAHAAARAGPGSAMPGAPNRWNSQRDQSWVPLRIERVLEVGYTIMTSGRFRGTTRFVRWRPDKSPGECTYDQLDLVPPMGLDAVLSS
ncbi:MAG: ATP-dependent DNA ligase [Acidimicrobiales bacterium]|nr:ATP-dependent DNA ligase [Acidimicrobiales bacterium]